MHEERVMTGGHEIVRSAPATGLVELDDDHLRTFGGEAVCRRARDP
jgi:hypothetical protein